MTNDACRPFLEGPIWADTTFSSTLPQRRLAAPLVRSLPGAERFVDYLLDTILIHRRMQDSACRNSWAFALTGAMLHAVQLAYAQLGDVAFDGRHMSIEFLTSCYESPGVLCGCFGADLCAALSATSAHGLVTFRQAPYVSTDQNQDPNTDIDVIYYCNATTHLGTCPPCSPSQSDYIETVSPATAVDGASRFSVTCFPCNQPKSPLYYPHAPFQLFDPAWSQLERAASVKAELRRIGPLAAALPIDDKALLALAVRQQIVQRPEDGILYEPQNVRVGVYHSVLIVGYIDESQATAFWVCRAVWFESPSFGYSLNVEDQESTHRSLIDRLFNVRMYDDHGAAIADRVVSFEEPRVMVLPELQPRALSTSDPLVRGRIKPMLSKVRRFRIGSFATTAIISTIVIMLLIFLIILLQ